MIDKFKLVASLYAIGEEILTNDRKKIIKATIEQSGALEPPVTSTLRPFIKHLKNQRTITITIVLGD